MTTPRRARAALVSFIAPCALIASISPAAQAGTTRTDYGFEGTAYGTRVLSDVTGLESARSAFSYIFCTRLAGKHAERRLSEIRLPSDNPSITVDAVHSTNKTFKKPKKDISGAMRGTNKISRVELGSGDTPKFTLNGLITRSTAWADNDGEFHTENKVKTDSITLVDLPEEIPDELQGPLDDLLGAIDDGIAEVLAALQENGGTIVVPQLGEISLGFDQQKVKKKFAVASSFVLRVLMYGPDQAKDGGDDSLIGIGRSWARINRDLPASRMGGYGYGADTKGADGMVKVGRIGEQPMPCRGTDGEVLKAPAAGLDLAGQDQLVVSGLRGRVQGDQAKSGKADAWADGSVSTFKLGPVEIRGIVGRVKVRQNKAGKIVKNTIKGSSIGEILVDGESQGGLTPKTAKDFPPLELEGGGSIKFFKKDKTARGTKVSAVVVKLGPDSPGLTRLRLGNARAFLLR